MGVNPSQEAHTSWVRLPDGGRYLATGDPVSGPIYLDGHHAIKAGEWIFVDDRPAQVLETLWGVESHSWSQRSITRIEFRGTW